MRKPRLVFFSLLSGTRDIAVNKTGENYCPDEDYILVERDRQGIK